VTGLTFSEKVLGAKSGMDARAGDIVVGEPDLILGTDGSTPMAIDYYEAMGGGAVVAPERVLLARDHYAPPTSPATQAFHSRMEEFAAAHSIELLAVGDGISFLVALETGRVASGHLVIGGDSHTVTCGVAGAFATGVGSSDLAAAFKTGKVWLRVPDTTRVDLSGVMATGVTTKDVALELVARLAGVVSPFTALEFVGQGVRELPPEDRIVLCNMVAEMGGMAGVFPTSEWASDDHAAFASTVSVELGEIDPLVALPHDPGNRVPIGDALGREVDWVFLGTCAGGRADDFREALRVLRAAGGIANGVTVAAAPPTAAVRAVLVEDGTLAALEGAGVLIAETGCGPCCGTSGPLPPPGARVISTANRNFRARMGEPSIEIMLGSPATCAAAAAAGYVVDPREVA
jgi:3-isopropylmalate/(R)-2-methylmalate dehydratase large subunit